MTLANVHDVTWRSTLRAHLIAGDSRTCSGLLTARDTEQLRTTLGTLALMVAAEIRPNGPEACPCGRGHNILIAPNSHPDDAPAKTVAMQLVALAANDEHDTLADLIEVQVAVTRDADVSAARVFLTQLIAHLALQLSREVRR